MDPKTLIQTERLLLSQEFASSADDQIAEVIDLLENKKMVDLNINPDDDH